LFDKYWYRQREFQYVDGINEDLNNYFHNDTNEQQEAEQSVNDDATEMTQLKKGDQVVNKN
tara:strand:- start:160 stop:342 length:183 start_codon:yes stop_codon:yes gene_type:complete